MKNIGTIIIVIFYLMSCLFLACSSEKSVTPLNTIKMLEVEETVVVLDNCYRYSFLVDSLLVFVSTCDTNIFHIYNKNSLEFIMKFGTKGRAPFEFYDPMPFNSNTAIPYAVNKLFYFVDPNLGQIKIIDFAKLIQGFDVSQSIISTVDKNLFASYQLNYLEGDRVAGINIDHSEGTFFIYNANSEKIDWINYLPKYRMQNRYRNITYRGQICSNGEIIAFASRYFDQVLFFSPEGELLKEHYFSEIKMPMLSDDFPGVAHESTSYFMHIYGNTKSCFVERINKPLVDLLEMGNPPVELLEFNWNGDLINVYKLNKRPNAYSVDETTNTLYCIIYEETPSDSVRIVKINL